MSKYKTKSRVQVEQQFLYNLSQIVESIPQYTLAQHLIHMLRRKNENKEAYFWSDETMLQKTEEYYEELKTDLITYLQTDDLH